MKTNWNTDQQRCPSNADHKQYKVLNIGNYTNHNTFPFSCTYLRSRPFLPSGALIIAVCHRVRDL